MSDFAIPKRASLEDIKDILKAYYLEGAHTEPVKTSDVEDTAGMSDKVGRQTKFLVEVGLLKKDGGRGKRVLTEDGESIAEALMAGNESLAQSLMRDAINEWEFTSKVTGFLRMQEPDPVEIDRLTEYISANASSSDSRGRKTLLELFDWCGIIKESEEGFEIANRTKEEENVGGGTDEDSGGSQPTRSADEDSKEHSVGHSTAETNLETDVGMKESTGNQAVDIQIEIRGDDDPDNVESVIKAVKRALETETGDE